MFYPFILIPCIAGAEFGQDPPTSTLEAPAGRRLWQSLHGATIGDTLGAAVATAGDLDQDGWVDWLVGVPSANPQGRDSGLVRLVSGLKGSMIAELPGAAQNDRFGVALAPVGDWNGDGAPDFAVGADQMPQAGTGMAVVYSGADRSELRRFTGEQRLDYFGAALAPAGDVNGDGRPDLLVGAPGHASQGRDTGAAYLWSGADGARLQIWYGSAAGDRFGTALAPAGDLDGDGFGDLWIGAPGADGAAGAGCGRVGLYSGRDGAVLFQYEGEAAGDRLGASLANAGDLDGDGRADLLAGAPGADTGGEDSGAVHVLAGANGRRLALYPGPSAGARFGTAVAAAGDVDRDGTPDLLVGASGALEHGQALVLAGSDGRPLHTLSGQHAGGNFGQAVAAGNNADGSCLVLVGAPQEDDPGQDMGCLRVFCLNTQRRVGPAEVAAGAAPEVEAAPPPPPPTAFLDELALAKRWNVESLHGGRWQLFSSVGPALTRDAAATLEGFGARLDELLGRTSSPLAAARTPVCLFLFKSKDDVAALCAALGHELPHLQEWADGVKGFARVQHYYPLLAVVRHDASTATVKRPEVQLAHMAVQLELTRRYGRLPYWIGEALGYALQDQLAGGVYGYSYRGQELLEEDYHQNWRAEAQKLFAERQVKAEGLPAAGDKFEQKRAYAQFGIASYWLSQPPERFQGFLAQLAAARPAAALYEEEFEPPAGDQVRILTASFAPDPVASASLYWAGARVAAGASARAAALASAAAKAAAELKLRSYASKDQRVQLWSDFEADEAQRALDACAAILARLDAALGKPKEPAEAALRGFLLREREAYLGLCQALAAAEPGQTSYMAQAKSQPGFTMYVPPITCFYYNVREQEEAKPENSIAHNLVHLELYRRYGQLPLWLAEGLACAGEEGAFGEVYGNWNYSGFMASASHGGWRETSSNLVERARPPLRELYAYSAAPFEHDRAHLAFAFATYGLDADPKGLAKFLAALQKDYKNNWNKSTRYLPGPETTAKLAAEAFSADFEAKFSAWWSARPKRKP